MKKLCSLLLALALACSLLTACGGEAPKETVSLNIKLPVLTMPSLNDPDCTDSGYFLTKAWDAFAEGYEKYDVSATVQVFEQTDYKAAIQDCYGSEDAVDLMFGGYFAMSGYIYDGYVMPLDDVITDEIKADFSDSSWSQSQGYNGKTYLLPFYALQNILSYNKDMFRSCGLDEYCYDDKDIHSWSLEEWDTILSTLAENLPVGAYPMMMYAGDNQGDTHTMIQLRCQGSSFFDDEGLFNLNTPEGIAGLQWLLDNYNKGYYPPSAPTLVINDCMDLFLNDGLAIYVYNTALGTYAEEKGIDVGFVNFPAADPAGANSNWITGFMAFDNGDEKKVEVLKDFLRFIYETPDLMDYSTAGIPCAKSVTERYGDQINMAEQFLNNEANSVDFTANNPNWADVRQAFWPHINALLIGEETPAEAAAGIDADCNAAITAVDRTLHE